jgi:aspartate-semialdehyde dehydrogenase
MHRHPLAIVGGESLLGREVRDVLDRSALPHTLTLTGSDSGSAGLVTEAGGEPVILTELDEQRLDGAALVFLAGSADSSRMAAGMLDGARTPLIDVTRTLEERPGARLRAPQAEPPSLGLSAAAVQVIAHPAAIALALFFQRLEERFPVRQSLVHVFEPASERGQRGLDELHQQTVSLLSFKALPKQTFDAQLSFNLLPRYGCEAPVALEQVEMGIERHLATLLSFSGRTPMPSLRLVQAPVFHGYSLSVWAEFGDTPNLEALSAALESIHVEVRKESEEAPTNAGAAGQSGIAVGAVSRDRNHPRACWFWLAADNLRLAAENAVALAESMLAGDAA